MSTATVQYTTTSGVTVEGDLRGDPSASPAILLHGGGQTAARVGATARRWPSRAGAHCRSTPEGTAKRLAEDGDYALTRSPPTSATHRPARRHRPPLVGASLGGLTSMVAEGEPSPARIEPSPASTWRPGGDDGRRAHPRVHGRARAGSAPLTRSPTRSPRTTRTASAQRPRRAAQEEPAPREDGRCGWHWDPVFMSGEAAAVGGQRLRADASLRRRAALPGAAGARTDERRTERGAPRQFLEVVPHARYADVSGAGHMVAGDRNDRVHGRTGGLPRRPPRGVAGTTARHAG